MTTTDARKRNRVMADAHETARARDAGCTTHFTVGNGWLANNLTGEFTRLDQETDMTDHRAEADDLIEEVWMDAGDRTQAHALLAIHDTLTEIRDRLPEREVACDDVWRDETERPCTRPSGHDGNHVDKAGTIWANPEPAPDDVDPDEERVRLGKHVQAVRDGSGYAIQLGGVRIAQCDVYGRTDNERAAITRAEKAEADLARVTEENRALRMQVEGQ